jgi:endonuclease/exonuclease/phosphatase (EEP) superfamily protein YafD
MAECVSKIRYPLRVLSLLRALIVTAIALPGLILLALLVAARFTSLTNWWPIEALDTFALYAFAPFLGVALAALLLWSRALLTITTVALLLFAQQFGPQLVRATGLTGPPVVAAQQDRPGLRVLTLNLRAPNDDPAPFLPLIRETQPDVIVFQEVTTAFARAFDRAGGDEYPFSAAVGTGTAHGGSGTWSRLPLGGPEPLRPSPQGNVMHRVRLLTGGGDLWIYNVHLANPIGVDRDRGGLAMLRRFDGTRRDAELAWLVEQTRGLDVPYILAGDFNSAAGSSPYRQFPAAWRDAFALVGRGLGHTFPSTASAARDGARTGWLTRRMPLIRIDYVLTSPEIEPVRAWTRQLPASDHLAVVADLELPSDPRRR